MPAGCVQVCVETLERWLSDTTACEALQAGVSYGQDQLRDSALQYIADHTKVHSMHTLTYHWDCYPCVIHFKEMKFTWSVGYDIPYPATLSVISLQPLHQLLVL